VTPAKRVKIHQYETDDPHGLARALIEGGHAKRDDRLETMRHGKVCLTGPIGWFADHRVQENNTVSPRFVKWNAFSADAVRPRMAKSDLEVG
jgi:hypothetical protein